MKYLGCKKVINTFKKYGGIWAIYYIVIWKVETLFSLLFSIYVRRQNIRYFEVTGSNIFKDLYSGDFENECKRIYGGERKLLFYEGFDRFSKLDIKLQWELMRQHHAPVVAVSDNCDSRTACLNSIFCKENLDKIFLSSNGMEVSISSVNLIIAFQCLNEREKNFYGLEIRQFLRSSLCYILEKVEKGIRFSNNHYFFNLLGMIWILESIKGKFVFSVYRRILYRSFRDLLNQITLKDGSLYEGSSHYHKYVTESLLLLSSCIDSAQLHRVIRPYAYKMFNFCFYASCNNDIVGIGDNDSGRLLPLPTYFDYSSVNLSIIKLLGDRMNLKLDYNCDDLVDGFFGLFKVNFNPIEVWIRLENLAHEKFRRVIGSHCHNDQLSIQLFVGKEPVLVDGGTYSYISDNDFRIRNLRTSSHNTGLLGNIEQETISNDWKYSRRVAIGKVIYREKERFKGMAIFSGGYTQLRAIEVSNILVIKDTFFTRSLTNLECRVFFHFHSNISILDIRNRMIIFTNGSNTFCLNCSSGLLTIDESSYSPEYGLKIANKRCCVKFNISSSASNFLVTKISIL